MRLILWLSNKIGVQSDKVLHFLVCFVITFITSFVNPIMAGVFCLILGLYKEFMDMHEKENYWSWQDIIADIAGICFGIILFRNGNG